MFAAEFWILACQNLEGPKADFARFFKLLLLLEFSSDFHETWHKYSTSQEEKNVVSGILNFGLCQNIRGPKAPLFLNRYLYSSQPISMKSCTNVVLVRRKKNVVSGILHFGPCQNLGVWNQNCAPFFKSLLLLQFSTSFHKTWLKCSTSWAEFWILTSVKI